MPDQWLASQVQAGASDDKSGSTPCLLDLPFKRTLQAMQDKLAEMDDIAKELPAIRQYR